MCNAENKITTILKEAPHFSKEQAESFLNVFEFLSNFHDKEYPEEKIKGILDIIFSPDYGSLQCEYISEWDCGREIRTKGEYFPSTKEAVSLSVEEDGIDDLNVCIREYILFPNGVELEVEDSCYVEGTRTEN